MPDTPPPRQPAPEVVTAGFVVLLGVFLCLLIYAVRHPIDRGTAPAAPPRYRIPLNTADAADLSLLPGVGPVTAQRIVQHRAAHGPFTSIDQLDHVPRIGTKTLERLTPYTDLTIPPNEPRTQ